MAIRAFDEAYVVSDLHLGGPPGFQMFASGDRFAHFISYLVKRLRDLRKKKSECEVLLVINGDFVDFLAEQNPQDSSPPYFLQKDAESLLESILTDDTRCKIVGNALTKWVSQTGAHLVIVLGNHDLELSLPDCREKLLQLLTGEKANRRSRVELQFSGWGYRFQVQGKTALCLHGNETDPHNFTRYDELDRIQNEHMLFGKSEFGETWIPSAGTKFVVDAVNRLKEKHPFVDLMHPMIPLVPAVLGLLDPGNLRYGADVAASVGTAAENELRRPASQRRMLSLPADALPNQYELAVPKQSADEIRRRVEQAMLNGSVNQLIRLDDSGRDVLWLGDWVKSIREATSEFCEQTVDLARTAVSQLKGLQRKAYMQMVRSVLRPLLKEHHDCPQELSNQDKSLEKTVSPDRYHVLFAGHTHHRRLTSREQSSGTYVNTGTWADRLTLLRSDLVDADRFNSLFSAIASQDRSQLTDPNLQLVRRDCPIGVLGKLPGQRSVCVSLGTVSPNSASFDIELFKKIA